MSKRKGNFYIGKNRLGRVEIFRTDVPATYVTKAHPNYITIIGPFSNHEKANKAINKIHW